jgi:2-oxoglutarate ferredoxin oxidoreductase subunit beta
MTFHPKDEPRNALGLTRDAYLGAPSTLCAGCGHDSITWALIQALFDLSIPPEKIIKLSGIGCSSKTPAYFAKGAHGFNGVHGRMPSVAAGATAAGGDGFFYIGISGDGDSGSIGLGQFIHGVRRQVPMLYLVENNGVYGLTKGQFSATSDRGSQSKKGVTQDLEPVDLAGLALELGAVFVARSFSGDKGELIPLIKGALLAQKNGFAFLDVLSPCVSFHNQPGSTKSYDFIRKQRVTGDHNPRDRQEALDFLSQSKKKGLVPTGLLYHGESSGGSERIGTRAHLPPGVEALAQVNGLFR